MDPQNPILIIKAPELSDNLTPKSSTPNFAVLNSFLVRLWSVFLLPKCLVGISPSTPELQTSLP